MVERRRHRAPGVGIYGGRRRGEEGASACLGEPNGGLRQRKLSQTEVMLRRVGPQRLRGCDAQLVRHVVEDSPSLRPFLFGRVAAGSRRAGCGRWTGKRLRGPSQGEWYIINQGRASSSSRRRSRRGGVASPWPWSRWRHLRVSLGEPSGSRPGGNCGGRSGDRYLEKWRHPLGRSMGRETGLGPYGAGVEAVLPRLRNRRWPGACCGASVRRRVRA